MKNSIKILLSVIVLSVLFAVGCKKDETSVTIYTTPNYINYLDSNYSIDKGFLENCGPTKDSISYNLRLTLLSSGIKIVSNTGIYVDSVIGHGDVLCLFAISNDSNKLGLGTYTYDTTNISNNTFNVGFFAVNFDTNVGWSIFGAIKNGTFEVVSNTNGNYVINFNLVDASGKPIVGYYKGPLGLYKGNL